MPNQVIPGVAWEMKGEFLKVPCSTSGNRVQHGSTFILPKH